MLDSALNINLSIDLLLTPLTEKEFNKFLISICLFCLDCASNKEILEES